MQGKLGHSCSVRCASSRLPDKLQYLTLEQGRISNGLLTVSSHQSTPPAGHCNSGFPLPLLMTDTRPAIRKITGSDMEIGCKSFIPSLR